jgi:hypothetical protein
MRFKRRLFSLVLAGSALFGCDPSVIHFSERDAESRDTAAGTTGAVITGPVSGPAVTTGTGSGTGPTTGHATTGTGGRNSAVGTGAGTAVSGSGSHSAVTGIGGAGGLPPTGSGGASGGRECIPDVGPIRAEREIISDFDRGNGTETVTPGGYWAPSSDGTGTVYTLNEQCGTPGNGLHFLGAGHTVWGAVLYAFLNADMLPVDASRFAGITFTMTSPRSISLNVKLENTDSVPEHCKCNDAVSGEECGAGYVTFQATPTRPTTITLPWSLFRKTGWGHHHPGQVAIDPSKLTRITFAVDKAIDFDFCVDDVKFSN